MSTPDRDGRVLVLAPVGRDAPLASAVITGAGISAEACADIDELCREISAGAGALVLTQEALAPSATERVLAMLDAQPPWSDLPLIVLVSREGSAGVQVARLLGERANATLLERPAGTATLLRAVEMALRARRRQYELRDHLRALAEAREAERHARAVAEEAVRERDEFLASVAHDLKNPLGAIKGFAQLLQRQLSKSDTLQPARVADHAARIEATANRAITQINELLDSARLRAGRPLTLSLASVDLAALVRRVAADWQAANPDHRFSIHAPEGELRGLWDAPRLERALANVIGNAVKYSPQGGEISLVLADGAGEAILTVTDEGIGIPRADLPHVFERFFRAGNVANVAGTGLGLAGVRQIVEQHGGAVFIESEEGHGTRITVRLPLAALRLAREAEATAGDR
jgi:signal transduction histidine kinase